jgi:transposase
MFIDRCINKAMIDMEVRYSYAQTKGECRLLEDRCRRAMALLDAGRSLNEVGRQIGCNPSSVMRWRDPRRQAGFDGLRVRFSPGRPLKLRAAQRKRLVRLLLKRPMAQGYRTNLWTTARIAKMVEREFGVSYHPDHIGRLIHSLGWTPQMPESCLWSGRKSRSSGGSKRSGHV